MSAYSLTAIYNMALSGLARNTVTSPNENSFPADICNLWYPICFDYLLARADWNFARVRVTLATLATNDRPGEWAFAFQTPADMAMPTRLLPALSDLASLGIFVPQVGQQPAITTIPDSPGLPYDWAGTTIYSNEQQAQLEYISSNAILTGNANALFVEALVARLRHKICMPLIKDGAKERELLPVAEVAEQRAIAANNNAKPQTYGNFVPEDVLAREGIDPFIQYPAGWRP